MQIFPKKECLKKSKEGKWKICEQVGDSEGAQTVISLGFPEGVKDTVFFPKVYNSDDYLAQGTWKEMKSIQETETNRKRQGYK